MTKTIINSDKAPAPIGPYNQAVQYNGLLFVSGQIPVNPVSGAVIDDSIEAATVQCMENVKAILDTAGLSLSNLLKVSIFVTDIQLFSRINEVYATYFGDDAPARELVQVAALPKGVPIEISVIAGA